MPSGTSDGSDFGGSMPGGGPYQSRFHRFDPSYPDRNVEIAVSPHGRNGGLRQQVEIAARSAGLEPQYVWADDPGGEQFVARILSGDPWNARCSTMLGGSYPNATGLTTFGAVCWKIPKRRGGHLEISYVTSYFNEMADYSTSIVVKIVPPLYETPQELAEQRKAALKITTKLTAWLQAVPSSPLSVLQRGKFLK